MLAMFIEGGQCWSDHASLHFLQVFGTVISFPEITVSQYECKAYQIGKNKYQQCLNGRRVIFLENGRRWFDMLGASI